MRITTTFAALLTAGLLFPSVGPAEEIVLFAPRSPDWIALTLTAPATGTGAASPQPPQTRLVAACASLENPLRADGCDHFGCDEIRACGGTTGGGAAATLDALTERLLHTDLPLLHEFRNRPLIGDLTYSVGGEFRYRYLDERNRLRPQGTLARSDYQQRRFTPFLEVGNEWVRGYVRAIDAPTFGEEIPELPIDTNRFDLLEYYLDARLGQPAGGELRARYGRMMLQYGDQHLVSPLAWANTFRVFEGGRLYYTGENWDVDGFVVRPSNGAASPGACYPESFDQADQSILFSGVYATWKKARRGTVDLFWLWNDEDEPSFDGGFGYNRQDGSRHTLGARYAGAIPVTDGGTLLRTWDWNLLGGWQFGEDHFAALTDQDVNAGFVSAIGGVTFDRLPWTPSVNGLFWWGSGDSNPNDGTINTVNTLYPLGHAYWGLIDNFNGANLLDYSVQVSVKPRKKLTLAAHLHWFEKASSNDYIYTIAGAPLGNTTTPDRHIGNELDLLITYQATKNLQLQLGYFWFWYGDAVNNQPSLARSDAQQFYMMTTWNF
jgi:hypothetical protein